MRFIVDQTQTPNLKVKVAILRYIEALARQMDPADFVNSSETRLAVSRIITWTTEPKSSDVRKVGGRGSRRGGGGGCCSPTFPPSCVPLVQLDLVSRLFCFDRRLSPTTTTPSDPSQLGRGGAVRPSQHRGLPAWRGQPGGEVQAGRLSEHTLNLL